MCVYVYHNMYTFIHTKYNEEPLMNNERYLKSLSLSFSLFLLFSFSLSLSLYIYIYISVYMYLPILPHKQDGTQGRFFKQSLNSEFSFSYTGCHTTDKETRLPDYFIIAEGGIVEFMLFPRVLKLCERQKASSRF